MTFDEILEQIITLLQRQGRVSYRALKIRFELDDEYLDVLKEELIDAQRVATDEDGRILVWTGHVEGTQDTVSRPPQPTQQPPTQQDRLLKSNHHQRHLTHLMLNAVNLP